MSNTTSDLVVKTENQVRIEVFAWLTKLVGGNGGGRMYFTEDFTPGEDVERVVRRMSRRHPPLDRALWDPHTGQLGASVELVVNDAMMGILHEMDTPVSDGDRITLLPAWDGG